MQEAWSAWSMVCVCVCQLEHASAKVCLQHSSVVLAVEVLVEDTPRNVIVAASDLKPSTPRTLPEVAAPTEVAQHSYSPTALRPPQRAQWAAWYIWPSTMTVRNLTSSLIAQ